MDSLSKEALEIITNTALGVARHLINKGASEENVVDLFRDLRQRAEQTHIQADKYDREIEDALDRKFGPRK